jgi:hypothetical protein
VSSVESASRRKTLLEYAKIPLSHCFVLNGSLFHLSFVFSGLATLLETGNMTNYPNVCAEATASFSVLSDTINIIQTALADSRSRKDLRDLIANLQQHEKEKLSLTAALHLDRIRESQQVGGDERILELLRLGVVSLRTKIEACVDNINEALEELRYAMVEEED